MVSATFPGKGRRTTLKSGKRRELLETTRGAQGVRVQIPVLTVTGARPGPRGVILAGQHGRDRTGAAAS